MLTFNGTQQNLVNVGTAIGGTFHYSLDNVTWGEEIPQGTNANEYVVYYKVVGDGNHKNLAENLLNVTIAKAISEFGTPSVSATYLQAITLDDIELPSGYAWESPETQITAAGILQFPAAYTDSSGDDDTPIIADDNFDLQVRGGMLWIAARSLPRATTRGSQRKGMYIVKARDIVKKVMVR